MKNVEDENPPVETADMIDAADIIGAWSNEQNEFKTLNCVFNEDRSGVLVTAIGMAIPFRWQMAGGGTIEMLISENAVGFPGGREARTKESSVIRAEYMKGTETIEIRGEGKSPTVLYPVQDEAYKVKKRKKFKLKEMYATERFVFSDLTVLDTVSGLTWTRDGSMVPNGEVVSFGYAKSFIEELNRKKYGGYDNWRLPTLRELKELARFAKGFYHETSPAQNPKNWGVASVFNGMGFFDIKPFYYWTSTMHAEFKGYPYCVSLTDGSDTFNIDYYTRYIWPVHGPKK